MASKFFLPGTLARGINVETTSKLSWLISNNTDSLALDSGHANDDITGEFRLNLEKVTIIDLE